MAHEAIRRLSTDGHPGVTVLRIPAEWVRADPRYRPGRDVRVLRRDTELIVRPMEVDE